MDPASGASGRWIPASGDLCTTVIPAQAGIPRFGGSPLGMPRRSPPRCLPRASYAKDPPPRERRGPGRRRRRLVGWVPSAVGRDCPHRFGLDCPECPAAGVEPVALRAHGVHSPECPAALGGVYRRAHGNQCMSWWMGTMPQRFHVYMLKCSDGSYWEETYVGEARQTPMTSLGGWPSTTQATYRGTRQPGCRVQWVWSQEFADRVEALESEAKIKKWSRAKKRALAEGLTTLALRRLAKKVDWRGQLEARKDVGGDSVARRGVKDVGPERRFARAPRYAPLNASALLGGDERGLRGRLTGQGHDRHSGPLSRNPSLGEAMGRLRHDRHSGVERESIFGGGDVGRLRRDRHSGR